MMHIVKVRDPVNNNVIVTIKNPSVKIEPYKDPLNNQIDLHSSIVNGI